MKTKPGKKRHRLMDTLPTGEIKAAERYIESLYEREDPFVQALVDAPEMPEPLSEEGRELLDEGRRALEAGDLVSDRELRAELGI